MRSRIAWLLAALAAAPLYLNAQWAVYRDPTIPRTRDGKPNLSAPAPRLSGKPDLTGIWQAESAPVAEIQQFLFGKAERSRQGECHFRDSLGMTFGFLIP